ncbi:MAG: YciI family protein [Acidimicrobiaceae bacterium]|nr:YciI family protein [Acidimicrobiaceae bacterium]
MKYLFLLRTPQEGLPEPGSPESDELYSAWAEALGKMGAAGVLIDCAPLEHSAVATTVRVRDGQPLLTDGPAAELKEQVGGYTLVECADLDEALLWAATLPTAREGSVEVRTVVDTGRRP